jgi:hypothetical protein
MELMVKGDGMTTDGYFAAHSRGAIHGIFEGIATLSQKYKERALGGSLYWKGQFQLGSTVHTKKGKGKEKEKRKVGQIIALYGTGESITADVRFGFGRKHVERLALRDLGQTEREADKDGVKLHDCSRLLTGHGESDGEEGSSKKNIYTIYYILYYTILYYTILYYTMLCYTILYYTILHFEGVSCELTSS